MGVEAADKTNDALTEDEFEYIWQEGTANDYYYNLIPVSNKANEILAKYKIKAKWVGKNWQLVNFVNPQNGGKCFDELTDANQVPWTNDNATINDFR